MKELVDECGCVLERSENGLHMVDCSLHSAAPELLGACKEAKGLLEGLDRAEKWKLGTVYDDICQAITKAEGK